MQIASEAIRQTFKHWPPSEGLTRQPYCLTINLHLITHNAPLVGGNLLGNTPPRREPGDNVVTPVYEGLMWPGTQNAMVERPGHSQPCLPAPRTCVTWTWHLLPPPLRTLPALAVPRHLHITGSSHQAPGLLWSPEAAWQHHTSAQLFKFKTFLRVFARFFTSLPTLATLGDGTKIAFFYRKEICHILVLSLLLLLQPAKPLQQSPTPGASTLFSIPTNVGSGTQALSHHLTYMDH